MGQRSSSPAGRAHGIELTGGDRDQGAGPPGTLLRRLVDHLRARTLPARLQWRLQQYRQRRREAWWQAHRGEGRSFLHEVQAGVRLRLHLDSELCYLIYCRHFEATERRFVNAFLRPGDVFVDVGANIGLFTLIAAQRVGREGRVLAFEPTARAFERLNDNVRTNLFANVSSFRTALSDGMGELTLGQSTGGFDAWNSFGLQTLAATVVREPVPTTTWDEVVRQEKLEGTVTMMKIDVEGWESRVLEGGRESLSRPDAPVLQVEFTDDAARSAGSSCRELYGTLEGLGYALYVFDPAQRTLMAEPVRESYPYANLIAAKDPDMVNARLRPRPPERRG